MLPTISCLCVTRGNTRLLQRAIHCFRSQTYSCKELIVIHQGVEMVQDGRISEPLVMEQLRNSRNYYILEELPGLTLGELRNRALELATGDLVAQWDDDDWYHPERLERQFAVTEKQAIPSCLLSRWLVFDETSGKLYRSFERREGWEGSMLVSREAARRVGYPPVAKSEDSSFMQQYQRRYGCELLDDPELYIYCYTGKNTWDRAHWEMIFQRSTEIVGDERDRLLGQFLNSTNQRPGK